VRLTLLEVVVTFGVVIETLWYFGIRPH